MEEVKKLTRQVVKSMKRAHPNILFEEDAAQQVVEKLEIWLNKRGETIIGSKAR